MQPNQWFHRPDQTTLQQTAQKTFLQRTAAGSLEEMLQEEPLDYG